jgi:large subunit ribosomal protein L23
MITIFGKKKESPKEKISKDKKENKKPQPKKDVVDKVQKKETPKHISSKNEFAWRSLSNPLISEKATMLENEHKYVFKVFKNANKITIKKAIEDIYNVTVVGVNIINIKRRKRRLGKTKGWKPGYKKAIVSLKKGQKIEIIQK